MADGTSCHACRHIFGVGSGTADNFHWQSEHTAIFAAGQHVVLYTPDTKAQHILLGAPDTDSISAMCISANRKFLAVGERAAKATVTIFDLTSQKRRKVLVSTIAGGKVSRVAVARYALLCDFQTALLMVKRKIVRSGAANRSCL